MIKMILMVLLLMMDITAGGGTEAVSGSHGDDVSCCLSDEVILCLAKLGIKVLISSYLICV